MTITESTPSVSVPAIPRHTTGPEPPQVPTPNNGWPVPIDAKAAGWEAWADWATARAGERQLRPENLGSERYPILCPAPGSYVRDVVPS
jgi:polyhydroxyalkanoate synthase subunit PhaC